MSRLFIGPREQAFINDLTKEFTKDVVGQYITLYPISHLLTDTHPVYDEAIEKVFENPILLDVLVATTGPERITNWDLFGAEEKSEIELFVQARDLVDKEIDVHGGDFFVYGSKVYEIVGSYLVDNIYGQAEYDKARFIKGKLARMGQLDLNNFKDLLEDSKNFKDAAVQKTFVQQRGLKETEQGVTNDRRQIRERLGEDMAPIALGEEPGKVTPEADPDDIGNPADKAFDKESGGFYNE